MQITQEIQATEKIGADGLNQATPAVTFVYLDADCLLAEHLTDSRLANISARAICAAFDDYQLRFKEITRRAKTRFERCEWRESQTDATERLDLYKEVIDQIVVEICRLLGERDHDKLIWTGVKAVYSGLIADGDDWELAETFFNSVTRRLFTTVGLDPQIEFVDTDFGTPPTQSGQPVYYTFDKSASTVALVETILDAYPFEAAYQHKKHDVQAVAAKIDCCLHSIGALQFVERAEMIKSVFYRRKGTYLVGRIFSGEQMLPLVLSLLNTPEGITVDAVLLDEDEVGILFSFTRSYFHVEVERPYDLVHFLSSIMPRKRIAELYIAIGYNKHGKTEMYRSLLHHLASSDDKFEIARGERGMVMVVFTMPSYDVVFKIIKDHFAYPKDTSRQEVMAQYRLVFQHDRAGRLVDAQEFEYLKIDRQRISDELLRELQQQTPSSVTINSDHIVIKHLYVERRVVPLNLYIREADQPAVRAAITDWGNAIKDLAKTNIFPGDMLLKNFGVTRHGRIVFYDYDELCLLTTCKFRAIPEPASFQEELSAKPYFTVGPHDIFPEEFRYFLGLEEKWRTIFMECHADLLDPTYWQQIQARIRQGEVLDIFPYDQSQRLPPSEEIKRA